MKITGQLKGERRYRDGIKSYNYSLIIWSTTGTNVYEINDKSKNLIFDADEPITIDRVAEDVLTPIIKTTCTINLLTKVYLGDDLFQPNPTTIKCVVYNTDSKDILFWGYVTPASYNQDFNSTYNSIQIQCIDFLSTLQYSYYYDNNYAQAVIKSQTAGGFSTFSSIIYRMFLSVKITDVPDNVVDLSTGRIIYISKQNKVFDDSIKHCMINDSVYLGESDEDHKSNEDVLNDILTYLSFNIVIDGKDVIIFHRDIQTNLVYNVVRYNYIITDTNDKSVGYYPADSNPRLLEDSLTFSNDEIYNKITIKCSRDTNDESVSSPLDTDNLESPYDHKELYMREYISWGEGSSALDGFKSMLKGEQWSYESAITRLWYMRYLTNTMWKLNYAGKDITQYIKDTEGITTTPAQQKYMEYLKNNYGFPCLMELSVGDERNNTGYLNNATFTSSKYLCISINGNLDDSANRMPTDTQTQKFSIEYNGGSSLNYTPSSSDTVNYIVFSSKMKYEPRVPTTTPVGGDFYNTTFADLLKSVDNTIKTTTNNINPYSTPIVTEVSSLFHQTVDLKTDMNGYYAQQYYMDDSTGTPKQMNDKIYLTPPCDLEGLYNLNYDYSSDWDTTDKISKLSTIICQMWVDDGTTKKYVSETFNGTTDVNGRKLSVYTWTTTESYFTLGVDPSINDKIIGTEFDMSNNITNDMNIDVHGMAIPIKYTDKIAGVLHFKMCGLVDNGWNDITRRHPTLFRHTEWTDTYKYIFSHASALWIKDFSCKIYSDLGGKSVMNDADIVYTSDENMDYVRQYNDIDFNISSALTTDEAVAMKVKNNLYTNMVYNDNKTPCTTVFGYDSTYNKAEKHYINYYYPLISTKTQIWEGDYEYYPDYAHMYKPINLYISPNESNGKYMLMPLQITHNLKDCSMHVKGREIKKL